MLDPLQSFKDVWKSYKNPQRHAGQWGRGAGGQA
jgi:hypothetical protein